MAEIITKDKKGKRTTRRSTRVDLTPMVDLGFLLITFFVFTTSLHEKKVMDTVMPNDKDSSIMEPVCESCALTVIPGKNNIIFYYEGMDNRENYKTTSYAASGLRQLIMEKKKRVMDLMHNDKLVLIIKPTPGSNFKNLVDILDETKICQVKRYHMGELNEWEKGLVQ